MSNAQAPGFQSRLQGTKRRALKPEFLPALLLDSRPTSPWQHFWQPSASYQGSQEKVEKCNLSLKCERGTGVQCSGGSAQVLGHAAARRRLAAAQADLPCMK